MSSFFSVVAVRKTSLCAPSLSMLYILYNVRGVSMSSPIKSAETEGNYLQLRKIGNSVGLILSKDLLARLHLKEGDRLSIIEQTDQCLKLTPYNPAQAQTMAKGLEIARRAMKTYHNALTELAK